VGGPTVGGPTVGGPTVGGPTVGGPTVGGPTVVARGALWWVAAAVPAVAAETFAVVRGEPYSLSLLADPVLAGYVPRAAAYLAWVAGFWVLARR
jgi:hypothetical protein